jgi:hypothetical protein
MANALLNAINEKHCNISMRALAESLYNAGYRKQSGNTVEFPCRVGQTIYVVDICAEKIIERKVTELSINEFGTRYIRSFGFGYPESVIGKTVFFTRGEAEQKMKGGAE